MTKYQSALARALAGCALILSIVCLGSMSPALAAGPASPANGPANGPKIWLGNSQSLPVHFTGAGVSALAPGQPVSMAQGDFDQDGIADLAVGYRAGGTGFVAIHRGNLDAFAPQSEESFQAIGRGEFPAPFLPDAQTFNVPVSPDFIGAGIFTASGHTDLVVAARGGNAIYLFAGDGKGNFSAAQTINLPGSITALAAGELGNGQPLSSLIIGVSGPRQALLAIYGGTQQGLTPVATFPLAARATSIALGDLDGDARPDFVVLAGGKVLIYYGATSQLQAVSFPFPVSAFVLGSFIFDRDSREQLALLSADGVVHIAVHNSFDPRAFSVNEWQAMRQATVNGLPNPIVPAPAREDWKVVENIAATSSFGGGQEPVLLRSRISGNAADDVMVLDGGAGQLAMLSHPNLADGAGTFAPGQLSIRPYSGSPVAALSRRVNIDGRLGVVALHSGETALRVMSPLPDPTFVVDDLTDEIVAGACNPLGPPITGKCSLREAIIEANATVGVDTIMVPAGTFTLTIADPGTDQHNASAGELSITDGVNIMGAVDGSGNPATIIQACSVLPTPSSVAPFGTCSGTGIVEKPFSVNPAFNKAFDTSFSNLEIRFGLNTGTFGTDGFGGGFDWEASHTGTMTVTNCNIHDNAIHDGRGGGITATNTGGGTGQFTISNSTVSHNIASRAGTNSGTGGGIFFGSATRFTITNTHIDSNQAVNGNSEGGGIFIFNPGTVPTSVIHGGTIAANTAIIRGGGIRTTAGITIDQGTVISNNTAQEGGGLWTNLATSVTFPSGETTTLTKVTVTGNSATGTGGINPGGGGGIKVDNSATGNFFVMSFSRLAGNTSVFGGSNLHTTNPGGAVTALNNWWGTNAASSTIGGGATVNCPTPAAGQLCFDPFIVLTHTANPSIVDVNGSTTLTADFLHDNHGAAIPLANIDVLLGLPITFNNAILGSISNAQSSIQSNGTATATFTTGSTSLPGPQPQAHADAVVDNGTAKADITIPLPPAFSKSFGATSIPLNGSTSLSFTLQNNNTVSLSNIAFSDTLPAGLVISTPNGLTGTCGGGTITATQGTSVISLSGATLAPSTSCTFSVNVTGITAGLQNNTTGNVSATESGIGGTASASLSVVAPPSIAKVFNPSAIALNATTSLTFTITNPGANADALAGVAFSDTLPVGLVVATPNGLTNGCGGTASATAGGTSISLTGGSVAVNSSCTVVVNVTGTATGQYTNTSGAVSSTNGGTGNTATANLTVASPPQITKQFTLHQIPLNGTTALTLTINNPNTNVTLTGIAFTDFFPSGIVVAPTPNLNNTCSGTATAVAGAASASLAGGTLAASASCTVSVSVQGTTAGVKNNSVQVTSTEGGAGNTSNDSITVVAAPAIQKSFADPSVALNVATTSMSFQVSNPNTVPLSGIGFTDNLPAGLQLTSITVTGSCGSGTVTAVVGPPSSVTLSGGTLAASSSCTFSVTVKGTIAGRQTNTTGNITSTEGGTGGTATASIAVVAPPTIAKAFNPGGIPQNGVSTLTVTITNPAVNTVVENGVAFTDNFPANLVVATPNGLTNTCGGTAVAIAGSGSVSLTGGSVPVNSSCTVGVTVTTSFTGSYLNSTGPVSSTNGGTGGGVSATLSVANPPTISKLFLPDTVAQNVSTLLSFTISNPNSNSTPPNNDVTLTGIAFTDALPPGLQIASPNNLSNDCGGTVTAVPGSASITLTGGALGPAVGLAPGRRGASATRLFAPVNGSCFVSVLVTPTAPGTLNNITGRISANESGLGATSNTASLTVTPGPTVVAPTLAKAFVPADIAVGQSTALTFTVTNPNATTPLINTTFTDALPGGLVVSSPNGLAGTCVTNNGASITANPGSVSVNLVSLNLPANSSCSFSVNVTGVTFGAKNNVTGAISATFDAGGGTFLTVTGGTSAASLNVEAPVMAITKSHTGTFSRGQTGATYTITVSNTGTGHTVGTVTVVDTLPAVQNTLVPTGLSGTGWTCDLPSLTCTRSDALPGGTSYPPITLTVNIPQNIVNHFVNTATVSGGGDPNNHIATDGVTLEGKPILITSTDSGADTIVPGMQATYNFTVDATAINPPPSVIVFNCAGLPKGTACIFSQLATGQAFSQLTLNITSLGRGNSSAALPFDPGKPPIYTALLLLFLALMGVTVAGRRGRRSRLRLAMALMGLMVLMALWGCGGNPLVTPPGTYTITVTATEDPASGTASGSTTVQLTVQ